MREIKFRAWDGERMHKAFDLTQNPVFWWRDNYDYPLMQYTGLKDHQGEEDGTWWVDGQWLAELVPVVTVVGNIYEHPELLKAGDA